METHNHIFESIKENKLPVLLDEYDLVLSETKILICSCGTGKIQYQEDYYWLGINDNGELSIYPKYRKRFERILSELELSQRFN